MKALCVNSGAETEIWEAARVDRQFTHPPSQKCHYLWVLPKAKSVVVLLYCC